jgi:hypothetical protein
MKHNDDPRRWWGKADAPPEVFIYTGNFIRGKDPYGHDDIAEGTVVWCYKDDGLTCLIAPYNSISDYDDFVRVPTHLLQRIRAPRSGNAIDIKVGDYVGTDSDDAVYLATYIYLSTHGIEYELQTISQDMHSGRYLIDELEIRPPEQLTRFEPRIERSRSRRIVATRSFRNP